MKLSTLFLATVALAGAAPAAFAYDASYYIANYWSGEYPQGFSVIAKNVSVPARATMDPAAPATIRCALPFRKNIHPWNNALKADFRTAAKIIPMVAKEDLQLGDEENLGDKKVDVKKGETIEYLVYGGEGYFTVRFKGKEIGADQSLLEKVSYDENLMNAPTDQWVRLTCGSGQKAWVLFADVVKTDAEGNTVYQKGLGGWYRGFRDYGKVTDLTNADLRKQD